MDNRYPIFEWLPGYEIDDNEHLILKEDNEDIEDNKETNGYDDDTQSREVNELLNNNKEINENSEYNVCEVLYTIYIEKN